MLDLYLRTAGWLPDPPKDFFREYCKWLPPPEIRAQFDTMLPRVIRQRFGVKPWETATHYMGKTIDIGSAASSKGPEDKAFVFNFAGGPKMVVGNFVMDGRKDPYGINKSPTGGGHMKSHHLAPFIASVQRGPEALFLASDNSIGKKEGNFEWKLVALQSHIVLPVEAQLWIKDQLTPPPDADKDRDVSAGEPIFIRYGDAAVGLRYLVTLGTDGKPAPLHWVNDGTKVKAMRLTCEHAETQPQGRGTVAFWARAAEGLDDAAFAKFRKEFTAAKSQANVDGDKVELAAAGLSGPLHIVADMAKGERKVVEGGEDAPPDFLLWVNGRDYAREILKDVGPIPAAAKQPEKPAKK
jgi:hypothetical protein